MQIAAIDIGSNSLHMIVCRVGADLSFDVIDREKDMVRLGADGLDGGRIAEASQAAALATLSRFCRIARSHQVDEILAVATSAVREAANGAEFVAAVERELGLHVRVISGTEEARLIHRAAVYAVDVGRRPAVVIDIGGGSTEITVGTVDRIQAERSFHLGVIRLTQHFVTADPIAQRDERRMVRHIGREAGAYLRQIARRRIDRVIGTSGTILALGSLAAGARAGDDLRNRRVAVKDVARLRTRLTAMTLDERRAIAGLDPRRADVAPAGIVLLDTLIDRLGARELTLCDFALREGLILDYLERNRAHVQTIARDPDIRRRSVLELAERCRYVAPHAQQVARLARAVFDGTRDRHKLGAREREWLEYGALLHDVGSHIGYERHHKHSAYLIRHGGLRGFTPEEVEIIALIARYHRRTTPRRSHEEFARLSRTDRRTVRLLSAMVRLAEGLDRSHAQVITRLRLRVAHGTLTIRAAASGDAELEQWAADRHATALAELLALPIRIVIAAPSRRSPGKDLTRHARHARRAARVSRPSVRR